MKRTVLFIAAAFVAFVASAQSEKYLNAMKSNVKMLDTVYTASGWLNAANAFQRIADAEKNQWLPYYYAALGNVMNGMMQGVNGKYDAMVTDQMADKADELIAKAEALAKDNSEIFVVKKLIATLKMMADPQTRYQQYGPMAAGALAKAKQLNPENPRVYLLEGQDKYFTPEQFGGSKVEAKVLFEESKKKFETFTPESEIHPNWGLNQVNYFLDLGEK